MVSLFMTLSKKSGEPVHLLMSEFGHYLFGRFAALYPVFFADIDNSFDFLDSVHNRVHTEVLKLYPDAQLPTFQTERINENEMNMLYTSERRMGDFAYGLISGCIKYFREEATILMELKDANGEKIVFRIKRKKIE